MADYFLRSILEFRRLLLIYCGQIFTMEGNIWYLFSSVNPFLFNCLFSFVFGGSRRPRRFTMEEAWYITPFCGPPCWLRPYQQCNRTPKDWLPSHLL